MFRLGFYLNTKQQQQKPKIFLQFQIFENDGKPQGICNNCIYRVQIAFDLKNQCTDSDFKLQQILFPNIENDSLNPITDR